MKSFFQLFYFVLFIGSFLCFTWYEGEHTNPVTVAMTDAEETRTMYDFAHDGFVDYTIVQSRITNSPLQKVLVTVADQKYFTEQTRPDR
ncbi:MAG: hypothetical protein JWL92_120 [Candidatus Nomurabacteria bacterium]|nr:hypothetical protein [Candidatus Nomurabacteria bacterium]